MHHFNSEHVDEVRPVRTRISWSAIFAGAALALGVYFLLASLGAAVGLSTYDRVSPETVQTGAIVWALVSTLTALFVGGLVANLYTAGENRVEAVLNGVIVWAVVGGALLVFGGAGIHAGFDSMKEIKQANWEAGARVAGVPTEQIEDWKRKATNAEQPNPQAVKAAAARIGWYAFAGTWLSMLAAAAGGCVGAGPTFRTNPRVTVGPESHQRMLVH